MNNTSISDQSSSIIYLLPPGKPDPTARLEKNGEERPRVDQAEQKGGTCWFYGPKRTIERIGKNFSDDYAEPREIEKKWSTIRKTYTAETEGIFAFFNLESHKSNLTFATVLKEYEIDLNKLFHKNLPKVIHGCLWEKLPFRIVNEKISLQFLPNFLMKDAVDLISQLFCDDTESQILLSAEEEAFIKECSFESSLFDDARKQVTDLIAKTLYLHESKLKPVSWKPTESIEDLIETLKTFGPLNIVGRIGTPFHVSTLEVDSIAGRKVFSLLGLNTEPGQHETVLIGAKKHEGGDVVYFLDPNDKSLCTEAGQQMYAMTYKMFIERLSPQPVMSCQRTEQFQDFKTYGYYSPYLLSQNIPYITEESSGMHLENPMLSAIEKQFQSCDKVDTEIALLERIQEFAINVPLNQKSKFECFFPYNPTCSIVLEFGHGHFTAESEFVKHDVCVFTGETKDGSPQRVSMTVYHFTYNEGISGLPIYLLNGRTHPCNLHIIKISFPNQIVKPIEEILLHRRFELVTQYKNQCNASWAGIAASAVALGTLAYQGYQWVKK